MRGSRWVRWRAFSPAQQRTLLLAAALLPGCWLALRLLGLARLQAWIANAAPHGLALSASEIRDLGQLVNTAARHSPFACTCLTRSLVLAWLLRRRGVDSELRIGVRFTGGALQAHAWVEHAGIPINDKPDVARDFAAFDRLVPATAFHAA